MLNFWWAIQPDCVVAEFSHSWLSEDLQVHLYMMLNDKLQQKFLGRLP